MSADDATTADPLTTDTESNSVRHPERAVKKHPGDRSSSHTRQTAAYWSMQRTMTDLS